MKFRKITAALVAAASVVTLAACGSQADTVNDNLAKEAEKFNIVRRIVGVNAISDKTVFEVTGRCSLEQNGALPRNLEVICKEDVPGGKPIYSKHFVGLSDNLFWVSTQLRGVNVSEFRTKFIFRPESIIPDIDLVTSGG